MEPDHCFDDPQALAAWLQIVSPAVVLPNWLWDCYKICDTVKAGGADLRVVGYCRSDDEETYYEPLIRYEQSCDWFVAVSDACRDGLLSRLPGRANRIRLIRTFVEGPDRLERGWHTKPVRLLYSGRLEQLHKRVYDLVGLAELLMRRGVHYELAIAGWGSSGPDLQHRMGRLPAGGRAHFVGELQHDAMSRLYAASDIILLPSDTEGLSNSVLEAMRHGCVPVVTRTSRELSAMLDGPLATGLVEVGAVDDMAARIEWLAEDPSRLRQRGALAHRATAAHSWPIYEPLFTSFLAEVFAAPAQ
jgi:glycosyltransferase involved in cell wall biosynthesis